MKAKELLRSVELLDSAIAANMEEYEEMWARMVKITPTLSQTGGSHSGDEDKIGAGIARLEELRDKLNAQLIHLTERRQQILSLLQELDNKNYYDILYMRYLKGMRWEAISLETYQSYRNVTRMHGRALNALDKLIEEKERKNDKD